MRRTEILKKTDAKFIAKKSCIRAKENCNDKDDSRVLVGEKVLHPAHKECYYK